jgi:hypothetical protein
MYRRTAAGDETITKDRLYRRLDQFRHTPRDCLRRAHSRFSQFAKVEFVLRQVECAAYDLAATAIADSPCYNCSVLTNRVTGHDVRFGNAKLTRGARI